MTLTFRFFHVNYRETTGKEKNMTDPTFEQNFVFFNILPFSPGEEEQLAAETIEYTQRTGNRNVLYSLSMHPAGFPAMKKAFLMIESYRKLKAALQGSEVRPGILFQSVLGHGARSFPPQDLKFRPVEPWVRMVNINGELTRYCPLDEGFRKYIFDMTVLFAKESPCFILGDDDIRSFSPKAECFCELHTAEFNKLTGKNFTPEEYRQAVLNSKPGDEINLAYETLRKGIPNGVAAVIRKAVESVDPEIRCGSCMPGWEFLFNGETSRCFAGKHPPVMRVANGNYNEIGAKFYPNLVVKTMALRQAHKDIPVLLDEADTCPHNLWSRASISMHAKLISSIFSGLNGAKLWYVNTHKADKPVSRNYTDILAENRGLYQTLAAECAKTELTGAVIPAHKNFAVWQAAHYDEIQELIRLVPEENMASVMLGQIGIPFQASFELDSDEVYAVSGAEAIDHLSDDELKKLLSRKLLLDGPAAAAVSARGFSDALGLTAEQREFSFNREVRTDNGKSYVTVVNKQVPFFTLKDDKAEVLTELHYLSYPGADDDETIAPATVFYKNSFGGTVCSMAFHHRISYSQFNERRKEFFIEVLEKLRGSKLPLVAADAQNITLITRKYPDGAILAEVCNINFDPLKRIALRCAALPRKVERLTGEGKWIPVPFGSTDNGISVEWSLGCYELTVLRLS